MTVVQAFVCPPATCSDAAKAAHNAFRRFRETQRNVNSIRRGTVQLPLPSPSTRDDDRIRPNDESDWPGGVRQRFRAIKPLIEQHLLEGYRTKSFGMLESPADGVGVWVLEFGSGSKGTVVANVTNATFGPFARLCAGEFGSDVLEDDHLLLAVNPSWTTSSDIGQLWDFALKRQAAALIDDPSEWECIYHFEDIRTATGLTGVLFRSYPESWKLYLLPPTTERGKMTKMGRLLQSLASPEPIVCPEIPIAEWTQKPERSVVIRTLNDNWDECK